MELRRTNNRRKRAYLNASQNNDGNNNRRSSTVASTTTTTTTIAADIDPNDHHQTLVTHCMNVLVNRMRGVDWNVSFNHALEGICAKSDFLGRLDLKLGNSSTCAVTTKRTTMTTRSTTTLVANGSLANDDNSRNNCDGKSDSDQLVVLEEHKGKKEEMQEKEEEDNGLVLLPKIEQDLENNYEYLCLDDQMKEELMQNAWSHEVHIKDWSFVKENFLSKFKLGRFKANSYSSDLVYCPCRHRTVFFECRSLDTTCYGWNHLQRAIDECYEAQMYAPYQSCSLIVLCLTPHPDLVHCLEVDGGEVSHIPSGKFHYDQIRKDLINYDTSIHLYPTVIVWDSIEVFLVSPKKVEQIFGTAEFETLCNLSNAKISLEKFQKILTPDGTLLDSDSDDSVNDLYESGVGRYRFSFGMSESIATKRTKGDQEQQSSSPSSPSSPKRSRKPRKTPAPKRRKISRCVSTTDATHSVPTSASTLQKKTFIVRVPGRKRPMYVYLDHSTQTIDALRDAIRTKFHINATQSFVLSESTNDCEIADDESVQFLNNMAKLSVEYDEQF